MADRIAEDQKQDDRFQMQLAGWETEQPELDPTFGADPVFAALQRGIKKDAAQRRN